LAIDDRGRPGWFFLDVCGVPGLSAVKARLLFGCAFGWVIAKKPAVVVSDSVGHAVISSDGEKNCADRLIPARPVLAEIPVCEADPVDLDRIAKGERVRFSQKK
jgi:hypothetical protein